MRTARLWMIAIAVVVMAAGCSGSAIDSSCDVTGISDEVEHMVGESGLHLVSLDSLSCAGGWALATATTGGDRTPKSTSDFLFERTDSGWFLRAPEIACANEPGLPTVPEALREDACRKS